jgi:hypothetical protein
MIREHVCVLQCTSLTDQSLEGPVIIYKYLIWLSDNLEGQIPIFKCPRNRVTQFYQSQSQSYPTIDGQSVSMSWYQATV